MKIALLIAVLAAMVAPDAAAQRRGAALRQERAFAVRLQEAVRTQDRAAVADLVRYPARVSIHLRPFPLYIQDRAALLEMYDMVFTPQLRCVIVASREATPGQPAPKDGLLLARGVVSLAGGRVIAERSGRGMQITRLSSFGDMGTRSGTPRRVAFDAARRDIQLAGRMAEIGSDVYVVAAKPNDQVQTKIGGFPDAALTMQVSRAGSDYRVEVIRRAGYCDPPVIPYLLTFALRR